MAGLVVNVDGVFVDPSRPHIPVLDRSFLYGDSLYEVVRTYGRKIYGLEEHLDRLEQSAVKAQMVLNPSRRELAARITSSVERYYAELDASPASPAIEPEAYVRLVVSRGSGPIGFTQKHLTGIQTVVVIVQTLPRPNEAWLKRGLSLQISNRWRNDRRALDPAMKSGNYLNSLLAYLTAERAGFDDALLCDRDGFLTEGTTFNIFYVKRNIVVTSPLSSGILEGITRRHVLDLARRQGLETRRVFFQRAHLYEADEIFAASSIKEVFPVTRIDQVAKASGPITQTLRQDFRAWAAQQAG